MTATGHIPDKHVKAHSASLPARCSASFMLHIWLAAISNLFKDLVDPLKNVIEPLSFCMQDNDCTSYLRWFSMLSVVHWIQHKGWIFIWSKFVGKYDELYWKNRDLPYFCQRLVSTQVHIFITAAASTAADYFARHPWLTLKNRGNVLERQPEIMTTPQTPLSVCETAQRYLHEINENLSHPALPRPKVYCRRCMLHLALFSSSWAFNSSDKPSWFVLYYGCYLLEGSNFLHLVLSVSGNGFKITRITCLAVCQS